MPESADPVLSLDQFLARNTSEDNASFSELMKENEQKHRAKHAWLFEKEGFQDRVGFSISGHMTDIVVSTGSITYSVDFFRWMASFPGHHARFIGPTGYSSEVM